MFFFYNVYGCEILKSCKTIVSLGFQVWYPIVIFSQYIRKIESQKGFSKHSVFSPHHTQGMCKLNRATIFAGTSMTFGHSTQPPLYEMAPVKTSSMLFLMKTSLNQSSLFFSRPSASARLAVCLFAESPWYCLTLCDPKDWSPPGFSVSGDSPGKNIGVGCYALLQGIFLIQGSNLDLLCLSCIGRWVLYHQYHLGSPQACCILLIF